MRTYVVWLSRRIVGTIEAPDKMAALRLAIAMWWGREVQIWPAADAEQFERYLAMEQNELADTAGRESEILYRIARGA